MNNDIKKLLKHTNRKRNRKSVNNRKMNSRETYYSDDTPSPDRYAGF